jgi:ATP-dependent RNA helicase DHX8/PRP22
MVRDLKDVVKRNQRVKVKVISIVGAKMSLSMKEVDQETGVDLFPSRSKESIAELSNHISNPVRPSNEGNSMQINKGLDMKTFRDKELEEEQKRKRGQKRMSGTHSITHLLTHSLTHSLTHDVR